MTASQIRRPSLTERLSRHFVWRLRHSHAADLIATSIENGLLDAHPVEFGGATCLRFRLNVSAADQSEERVLKTISSFEQIGLGLGHRHRFIFEDGEIVVDESFDVPRVKRSGAREIALRGNSSCEAYNDTAGGGNRELVDLPKLIQAKAVRPLAGDVAALLLLAEGIGNSGFSIADVVGRIAKPRSISTIYADVDGFEGRILQLLSRGLILPGESVITNVGQKSSRAEVRMAAKRRARRNIVSVAGSLYHADSHDKAIAEASKGQLPILAISEFKNDIPKQLRAAADLQIACPSLTPELIAKAIEAVTAEAAVSLAPINLRVIGLDDLDLAIGQGNSAAEAIERLAAIARDRVQPASSTTTSERFASSKSGATVLSPTSSDIVDAIEVSQISGYPNSLYDWTDDLKRDLQLWKSGSLPWADVGATLLLSGPPGTGKTAFARSLAKTVGASLVQTSVSSWLQPSYLGAVLKAMRSSFSDAAAQLPTVLFVDEIDGIGTRSGPKREYADYWNSVVNNLLELLNPAMRAEGVIFVGATNRPDYIDTALMRAGRLKPHIEIGLPKTEALAGIFRQHLGADLARVVRSAPPTFMPPSQSARSR